MHYPRSARGFRPGLLLFLAAACLCLARPGARAQEESPPDVSDLGPLEARYTETYGTGDYAGALEIANEIVEITWPIHVEMLYNIARLHNLTGEKMKAYEYLQTAVDAGYWNAGEMRADDAFENLREEKRFRKLVRGAWANGYVWVLERPERDEFQQPERVMEVLAFKPGERVADIGAGTGYFTVRVAKAVGPTGTVLAHDISEEMLDYLERRLEAEQLENVVMRKVERDDPMLPEDGVDTILLVDTWHYIRDPEYAKKLRAGLASGGRVIVVDYRPRPFEERPWGPPPEQQTPREELDAHFAQAGLVPVREYDFLSEQYIVEYEVQ